MDNLQVGLIDLDSVGSSVPPFLEAVFVFGTDGASGSLDWKKDLPQLKKHFHTIHLGIALMTEHLLVLSMTSDPLSLVLCMQSGMQFLAYITDGELSDKLEIWRFDHFLLKHCARAKLNAGAKPNSTPDGHHWWTQALEDVEVDSSDADDTKPPYFPKRMSTLDFTHRRKSTTSRRGKADVQHTTYATRKRLWG